MRQVMAVEETELNRASFDIDLAVHSSRWSFQTKPVFDADVCRSEEVQVLLLVCFPCHDPNETMVSHLQSAYRSSVYNQTGKVSIM